MPIISVIVPNYDQWKYLRKRIDSIFAQTFQDFKLILHDDVSTDDSREVIELYRKAECISPKLRRASINI